MRLGIFAKIFARPTLAETLDAVSAHGLDCIQFNFACAGLPTLPDEVSPELAARIGGEIRGRQLSVAAVSGTFNMIDSDPARRREGLRRLEVLAGSCAALGTSLITLCTGTRDPKDMWRHHPDNASADAWRDLLESMAAALAIAERYRIFLGVEPETANVISSAKRARLLLEEMKSPRLKIVMDASNLFHAGAGKNAGAILSEAFDLLGRDIALAHAKDYYEAEKLEFTAPGRGVLPWAHYMRLLRTSNYAGPLVMHSLEEAQVDQSVAFLRQKMTEVERPARVPISSEFFRDGIHFNYQDAGRGLPFFYQHGLGGNVNQTFGIFQPPAGFRMISFDCRGHGQTHPVGPDEKISLATFADDLLGLMDHLAIERAVVGGISMGAAIALNFALRHPERVRALILQRPAWLDAPRHENVEIYTMMAQLIRRHGPLPALDIFKESAAFKNVLAESPLAAKSMIGYFLDPRAAETVALLERIPVDSPHPDRAAWRALRVPTLVLANRQDQVHPYEYGVALAAEIPGAEFHELTPKAVSLERHNAEVQRHLEGFLLQHF